MKHLLYMVLICSFIGAGHARADDDHLRAKDLVESGEILPLETILLKVYEGHQWRLLEAELEEDHGRYIYELEILDDKGKVQKLKYDAKTGLPIKGKKK